MKAKLAVPAATTLLAVLAACGQSPTAEQQPAGGGGGKSGLEAVYAELEGLEGEERTARLAELAAEEGGSVSLYTSTNVEESGPITDAFTDRYGIEVELYRASSSDVLQRLLEEADAGYRGADVVSLNGTEMQILDREGLLLPLRTPAKEDIVEVARYDTWAGLYLNVFVAAWNTDALSRDEYPETWEQVLTDYPGRLAMELGDWDWFATLVNRYFIEEKGMTEEEAVELFRGAARNAAVVDGHTTMAQLLAAGEYTVVSSAYQHRIPNLQREGGPVAWEPPPEPIIVRPNGIGIPRDTEHPASALLFAEYGLTDAQEMLAEFERTPANPAYGGVPEKYELETVDLDKLLDERKKWESLYAEIVRESGSEVVS